MFIHLESSGGGFEPKLSIAPRQALGKNWFTVFIAENGGRKSFLLRCLVEAGLGRRRYAPDKGASIQLLPPANLPERVIAISGTPLDRFPRAGTRDLKAQSRKTRDDFVYLGPRASNGMAGVAQSERSFVGSLITNRHRIEVRSDLLQRSFSLLGLAPHVDVYLQGSTEKDRARSIANKDLVLELEHALAGLAVRDEQETIELLEAIQEYKARATSILAELDRQLFKPGPQLRLGAGIGNQRRRDAFSPAMWELLIRLGQVVVAGTQFHGTKNLQKIPGEQLSSGQWGWLGTFGSLVAEMRHNSLILVDEPENSLHPRWQQEFIRELHAIVSGFENCQVVVATHSPLIASGVSQEWGSIRTLTRPKRVGAFVRSVEVPTAFGWSASDVYDDVFGLQSTRAPDFLASANEALKKLSARTDITDVERDAWITQFTENSQTLPPFDSMRDVLESIVRRLKESAPRPSRTSRRKASQ